MPQSKTHLNYMKNDDIPDKIKRDIALNDLGYSGQTLTSLMIFLLGILTSQLARAKLDSIIGLSFLIFVLCLVAFAFLYVSLLTRGRAVENLLTIERKIFERTKESDIDKNTTCRCVKIKFHAADHSSVSVSASSTACGSGLVINLCLTQARGSDVSTLANVSIEARS